MALRMLTLRISGCSGNEIAELFKAGLHKRGLKGRMRANTAGCLDQCASGPTVESTSSR